MLIIGKHHELFDSMPHVYGVDNKVIFDKRLYDTHHKFQMNSSNHLAYSASGQYIANSKFRDPRYVDGVLYQNDYQYRRKHGEPEVIYTKCDFYYCGRIYLLAYKSVKKGSHYVPTGDYYRYNKDPETVFSIEANDYINKIASDLNLPYFLFTSNHEYDSLSIDINFGFVSLNKINIDLGLVDKIYGDVYSQLMKYMNDKETVQVSNEQKIIQSGFDLKTSFRKG